MALLRSSGVETDIRTGRPMERKPVSRQAVAQERLKRAILNASEMAADLHQNNALLKKLIEQYAERIQELTKADPVCQTLGAFIDEIIATIEWRPILAEREALRVAGPQLANLYEKET
jgi:hypothetical protein